MSRSSDSSRGTWPKVVLKQSGRNSERAAGLAGEKDEAGPESAEAG